MRWLIEAQNRRLAIEGGRIVPDEGRFDAVLRLPDCRVRAGLINAHDHLHRNHYGRLGRPPYPNAVAWAHDIQRRCAAHIARRHARPRRDALLDGAWKNLFAGVTTVMHHDRWEPDFDHAFPVRVAPVPSADSLGMAPTFRAPRHGPYALHLAEGTNRAAADEVRLAEAHGLLTPRLIAVHGLGMDTDGIARFRHSGAALTLCPASNLWLFGQTAPPSLLDGTVDVLLGTDSRLSGPPDLLAEIALVARLGLLPMDRIEAAVGSLAAARLGLPAPSLDPGAPADIAVLSAPLGQATIADVALVVVAGQPRVARADAAATLAHLFPGMRRRAARWTWDTPHPTPSQRHAA